MKIQRKRTGYLRQYKGQPDGESCRIEYRLPTPKEWMDWQAMLVSAGSVMEDQEADAKTVASVALMIGTDLILKIENLEVDGEPVTDAKVLADVFPYQVCALAQNLLQNGGGVELDLGESEGRRGSSPRSGSASSTEKQKTRKTAASGSQTSTKETGTSPVATVQ